MKSFMRARWFPYAGAILLFSALVALAQQPRPFANVFQRPMSRQGYSEGVGAGSAFPTLANSNRDPSDAELYVVDASDVVFPILGMYSLSNTGWLQALTSPRANLTESQLFFPTAAGLPSYAEAEDALASDLVVVCYRFFNQAPITITEAVLYEMQVASAGATDYLGVAIYPDADAGARLATGASVYAADGAALVIDLSDVTLETDWYRVCGSQNDVSAQDWMAVAIGTGAQAIIDDTAASEAQFGLAANASTGNAVMPTTTGALAATTEAMPLLKLQSN